MANAPTEPTQEDLAREAEDFFPDRWDVTELSQVACCTEAEAITMLRVGEARRRRTVAATTRHPGKLYSGRGTEIACSMALSEIAIALAAEPRATLWEWEIRRI